MTWELSGREKVAFRFRRARRREHPFVPQFFGMFALVLLSGYALFGKGFAYMGISPVFIGEIGLCLAAGTIIFGFHQSIWKSTLTWLLMLFMIWGAICTFPYLDTYGLDALRDGVVWGYALYALGVATTLLRLQALEQVVDLYGRGLRVFLLLAPALLAIFMFAENSLPRWPWGPGEGVSIIYLKGGDVAVHYAGIFAFIALGLSANMAQLPWTAAWFVGAAPVVMLGRSAFLTVALVVCVQALLRRTSRSYHMLFLLGVCVFLVYLLNIEVTVDTGVRNISLDQLWVNIQSIFGQSDRPELGLELTRMWRELWWRKIFDYTFLGDYFWMGKGFGINLADADGFQVALDHSLRSPHNVHMTVLARSGIPGLLLWVILQATFGLQLLSNYLRDRRSNRFWLARVEAWVLLYWLAFMINGSFDVFLEGPQGGIWFWSLFGFGLALIVARDDMMAAFGSSPDMTVNDVGRARAKKRRFVAM